MTDEVRHRRIRWPNDRRGVRLVDAAEQLGVSAKDVYWMLIAGTFAFWRAPETQGTWLDADEVDAYVERRAEGGPPDALAG